MKAISRDGGDEDEEEVRLKSPLEEEEDPALQGPKPADGPALFFPAAAAAAIPSSFFVFLCG